MQESLPEVKCFCKSCALYEVGTSGLIMNAFIFSQFGYCPLLWMFHSRNLNNRINNIHERALRIVYRDYESTFQQLLK